MPMGLMGLRSRGPGMGLRRAGGGILYLIQDLFTTDRAAGAVNNTQSEPGGIGTAAQKTRTVVDSESKLTISGQRLLFSGGMATPASGDPGLWFGGFARAAGLAFYCRVALDLNTKTFFVGYDNNQSGAVNSSFQFSNLSVTILESGSSLTGMEASYLGTTEYDLLLILRNPGVFFLFKPASSSQWLLSWVGAADSTTPVYPSIVNNNASGYAVNARLITVSGQWATQYGPASLYVASPTNGYSGTGNADGHTEITWTPAAGETLELSVRRTDDNNRWVLRCSQAGSTAKLIQIQDGIETERATNAKTWTIGTPYRITARAIGNVIRMYTDRTLNLQYVSASWNNTATGIGVSGFATGANLAAWPRSVAAPSPFEQPSTGRRFLAFGDSKAARSEWQPLLISALQTADPAHTWSYGNIARNGWTAALWADASGGTPQIDTDLGAWSGPPPDFILVNLGANDIGPLADPLDANTWKTNFAYNIDALLNKFPLAVMKIMLPGRRYDNGQGNDLCDTWIPEVVTPRAARVTISSDERIWFKNGDNYTTLSDDGLHYNTAGNAAAVAQWKTAMGY